MWCLIVAVIVSFDSFTLNIATIEVCVFVNIGRSSKFKSYISIFPVAVILSLKASQHLKVLNVGLSPSG